MPPFEHVLDLANYFLTTTMTISPKRPSNACGALDKTL